ncbi:MAG: class I SAM-dependent methyltransferase [Candidatus Cloacimonadota bacterium]|nr:class I SAM-dependent methyltransferase [Candidatus Cloacimonadota bacterium]
MLERIIESYQNEVFTGMENARKYAEESEKSSKMRFRGFLKKIDKLNIKGNYLEIGAGSGTLAAMIAKRNKDIDITAIEISADMITVANEYIKKESVETQISFIEGNIEDDELSGNLGKFDLVYSTFSLHHWKNPEKAIKKILQYVKEDGVLLIYDLKRVWWLYWIKKDNGFYKSIRASYQPNEIRNILNIIDVKKYEISNIFPYFMQNITIWK